MGKPMTLTEIREAIASESKRESERLKEELELLNKKYITESKESKETIDRLQTIINALSERCYAILGLPSNKLACLHCTLTKGECKHAISFDEKAKFAEKEYKNAKRGLK